MMTLRQVVGLALMVLVWSPGARGAVLGEDWENPHMIGHNKTPAHCTLMPYADRDTALTTDKAASTYYQSLDGDWAFNWVRTPAERPTDFVQVDFDDRNWDRIEVPSCWQLQGYGIPINPNG